MKEARYFYVPHLTPEGELPTEEALHAVRVLRLHEGHIIWLMDGEGSFVEAEITLATQKHCHYRCLQSHPQQKTWRGKIHIAIAPTKMMERMEWMTEKATEVGWDCMTLLDCNHSERKQLRVDRLEKVVVSAMKQSRKAWLPQVKGLTPFHQFVDECTDSQRFIAHCYEEIPRMDLFTHLQALQCDETVSVAIGPEGDFSLEEVQYALQHGWTSVTLGQSRLRTETAGLTAVMMAQICKRI